MKRIVTYLLIFTCLLALVGTFSWLALKRGIDIAHFSIASVSVSGLSLSLDRGFILHIDQIDIADTGTSGTTQGLEKQIPRIKKWGSLIQEIDIQHLAYQDYKASLMYRDGQFQIEGTDFTLRAKINYNRGSFLVDLSLLEIKPLQLTFQGKGSYERTSDTFLFSGTFKSPWGRGALDIKEQKERADVRISTKHFTDLAAVLAQFPIDPDITDWVAENITAASYKVEELRLQFKLSELKNLRPDNIHGTAVADSASIRFHPDLPPVQCEKIQISFQDDRLSFKLLKPTYKDKKLDGSSVYIDHIIQPGTQLVIHIKTRTKKDADISELLKKYDVDFPAQQKTGTTTVDQLLTFDLPQFTLTARGTYTISPGKWIFWGIPIEAEMATLQLADDIITIDKSQISYQDILRGGISGVIDIATRKATLQGEIDSLNYRIGETEIIKVSRLTIPLEIDYTGNSFQISSTELATSLRIENNRKELTVNSIAALLPVAPILQNLHITDGSLRSSFKNLDSVQFDGVIDLPNPYLSLNGQPVSQFRFKGTRTPEKTDITINNGRISVSLTDKLIADLKEYLVTVDTNDFKGDSKFSSPLPMEISGPETLLKVKELQILTQEFKFQADDSSISFDAQMEKGNILFESNPPGWNFTGRNLNAATVDMFSNNVDMTKGTFNISLNSSADTIEGFLDIQNILIKNTKLLNNILAFINTIPALVTFSSPGFDRDGYLVNEGAGHFTYQDKMLTIHQLRTDGDAINIEVEGWINQETKTLQLDFELFALNDYSKIVSKIPLAGYAMLGDDGLLSTSLEITGSLDKPDIKTNLAHDILSTPIHVIRRTLQWPFKVFDDEDKEQKQPGPDQSDPGQP